MKATLIKKGFASKLASIKNYNKYEHCFYDATVFKKLKAVMGGRVRIMATGSAPINDKVKDFFRCAMGC